MSNLLQRLLLFFIGVPLVVAIILLLPQCNHAAAVLVILAFTGGCSVELSRLFRAKGTACLILETEASGPGEFIEPEPRLFNFNSPLGACQACEGFGNVIDMDMDLITTVLNSSSPIVGPPRSSLWTAR